MTGNILKTHDKIIPNLLLPSHGSHMVRYLIAVCLYSEVICINNLYIVMIS